MAKHPVMLEYSYELKENMGRRAIALAIDLFVVSIFLFPLFVFLGLGVLQANPMNSMVGLLGPLIYTEQVEGAKETTPFLAMIVFVILQTALLALYHTWRESNSRRTIGKKIMHLDPIRQDEYFPTKWDAFQRNYLKYFLGALGGYLLGMTGWVLFIGIGCLIDLKIGPEYKYDLRQRLTEVPFKTAALNENPKVPIGRIAVDEGKWARMKEKEEKAKKYAKRLKREERAKNKKAHMEERSQKRKEKIQRSIEKTSHKTEEILEEAPKKAGTLGSKRSSDLKKKKPKVEKAKVLLTDGSRKDEEEDIDIELEADEPEKDDKPDKVLLDVGKPKDEDLVEPESKEEEKGPAEKKVPFWKKLFGGGSKEETPEEDKEEEEEEKRSEPMSMSSLKKDASKDETILQFMMDFDIDEKRAHGLYDMGYRKKEDLKDAIPQDLMMIPGFNPTISKKVLRIANE